jgi:uncharacterized protein YyaL (SSP411 family)
MHHPGALALPLLFSISLGCAAAAPRAVATTPTSAPQVASAQAAEGPDAAPKAPLPWQTFDASLFARAKKEHRFVVLDGSAEWCHWCHVMEATTYHDDAVREVLGKSFLAAKVDVDSRPDVEERYGDYGWPATVIFSPDGRELGKYRGYIPPEQFVEILRAVVESPPAEETARRAWSNPGKGPLSEEELAWIARFAEVELAEYYDDERGGWGRAQKAAIASDNAWTLSRARAGDAAAKARALFTLDQQRALLDPVWGGMYQYSAAADWEHPHFEKLMTFQAGALDNYADAYALTRDPKWLADATAMRRYLEAFLLSPDGAFYATQDADLNAHETDQRAHPFLSGHAYYAMGDAERRARGVPRIDTHEYGRENGLAIGAYVSLYEATKDATALAVAERAAARVLATHATERGGIAHEPRGPSSPSTTTLHLADNAAFGLALMRLHEATGKAEHLGGAKRIAAFLLRDLQDGGGGGFYASTPDPDAVGVFAERRKPFEDNVTALRFLARLAKATHDPQYTAAIAGALRAIATPDAIKDRGRMIGDLLMALDETRGVR